MTAFGRVFGHTMWIGIAILVGCDNSSEGRGSVKGKVSFDGKPVEKGMVTFTPTGETKGPAAFATIENGAYKLKASDNGPVIGSHKVTLMGERDSGKKDSGGATIYEQVIPSEYSKPNSLTAQIKAGENEVNLELPVK